jgi:hypothetical protein
MKGESPLLSRIKLFPIPLKDFDPMRVSDKELWEFGIAPRPDREREAALYDVWFGFFGTEPEFVLADIEIKDKEFQPATRKTRVAHFSSSRFETSKNWCPAGGSCRTPGCRLTAHLMSMPVRPGSGWMASADISIPRYRKSAPGKRSPWQTTEPRRLKPMPGFSGGRGTSRVRSPG